MLMLAILSVNYHTPPSAICKPVACGKSQLDYRPVCS